MRVPRLTRGRLTATWVVLRSASRLGNVISRDELISFARRSGLRSGGLPISDGFDLALIGDFINLEGPTVSISHLGLEALSRCKTEEPNPDVLRLFLSVFLLRFPPAWVAFWQGDPSSLDVVLPEPTKELLADADVAAEPDTSDLESWALWDALQCLPQPTETAAQLKAVGNAAEQLSVEYEKRRLAKEGYPDLSGHVRWVARESAAYGFDILSFFGSSHASRAPTSRLAIEVKGQSLTARQNFSFFLTRHEWRTANSIMDAYIFHFWHGIAQCGSTPIAAHSNPVVVTPGAVAEHIPLRPVCGSTCDWNSARITLPITLATMCV